MPDKIQYQGLWNLPSAPETRVSGTFSHTEGNELNLELIWNDTASAKCMDVERADVIHGTTASGRLVTLFDSLRSNRTMTSGGFIRSTFISHFAFVGAQFSSKDDVCFDKLFIQYRNLDEWANISGFEFRHSEDMRERTVTHRQLDSILLAKIPSCEIYLTFSWKGPDINFVQKSIKIEQSTFICLQCENGSFFEKYIHWAHQMGRLLSLATTEACAPVNVSALVHANQPNPQNVDIFYEWVGGKLPARRILPNRMLFTYSDATGKTQKIFGSWFKGIERLDSVYNLYFATLFIPNEYVDNSFFNLVRAVEIYHRRSTTEKDLPEDEHSLRITRILSSIDKKYKKWLEEKLKYSNELTLRKRLNDLLVKYDDVLENVIIEKKKFVSKVIDTRNYLTHFDKRLKNRCSKRKELMTLSLALRLLLEIAFLDELGIERGKIREWIARTDHYRLLRQWGAV